MDRKGSEIDDKMSEIVELCVEIVEFWLPDILIERIINAVADSMQSQTSSIVLIP